MSVGAVRQSINRSGKLGEIISSREPRETLKEHSGHGLKGHTKSFWEIVNSVEFPGHGLRMKATSIPEIGQLEKLLGIQNKLYQGGLVVELVSKSADAAIHGVKRLQSAS